MPPIPESKPYRIGRSRTGLGLFATKPINKGTKIIRYFGPLLDAHNEKHDAIENKYLFQINKRWTIDGSIRKNIARYINHSCKPNAESDVNVRKRKVIIRAIKKIEPGDEINYDYGTEYFKAFLKPIGCKCDACEKKRAKKAAKTKTKAKAERAADKAKSKTGKGSSAKTKKAKGAVANKVKTKTKAAADKTKTKTTKTKTVSKAKSSSKAKSPSKAKSAKSSPKAKAPARATASKAKAKSATKPATKAKQAKRPAASKRTRKA